MMITLAVIVPVRMIPLPVLNMTMRLRMREATNSWIIVRMELEEWSSGSSIILVIVTGPKVMEDEVL